MITAITFDFWDTIVFDGSDEPARAARGLPPKPQARLQLLTDEITQHHPDVTREQVARAFNHANERVRQQWQVEYHTPPVSRRLQLAYDFLQIPRTPGFDSVVQAMEEMEVNIPPDFVPGVHAALAELAQKYRLGIISDTIHTPGRGIRQLLAGQDLLRHFRHWVFSDEVGASKPAPIVFQLASAGLAVPFAEMIHVGDRESNDVEGSLAVGMQAILFTGVVDRGSAQTRASAVCRDFAALPAIIKELE